MDTVLIFIGAAVLVVSCVVAVGVKLGVLKVSFKASFDDLGKK